MLAQMPRHPCETVSIYDSLYCAEGMPACEDNIQPSDSTRPPPQWISLATTLPRGKTSSETLTVIQEAIRNADPGACELLVAMLDVDTLIHA